MLFSIIVKVIVTLYALLMVFASIREFNSKEIVAGDRFRRLLIWILDRPSSQKVSILIRSE